jgi:transketolase
MTLEPFTDKWIGFGWDVIECNGHNHEEIKSALDKKSNQPKVIIANTIKGFGVSFMESNVLWHYRSPQGEEYKDAILELSNHEK